MDSFDKMSAIMTAATLLLGVGITAATAIAENKADKKGREITEEGGVFKSKGRYYAYCPTCGRKCGHPQIIPESNRINVCTFRCYSCNKDFTKKFDRFILKG